MQLPTRKHVIETLFEVWNPQTETEVVSEDGHLTIAPDVEVRPNKNVRPCGSTIQQGEIVGRKDRKLRAFDLACLAMGGVEQVEVYKTPRVAFLPTGSELVALGDPVTRGTNIDSNSVLVKHTLIEMGADPILYPITKDDKKKLEARLEEALEQADVVIISGGSSKGKEDFNARILEERGAALFHWVAAAPGKPMCVAVINNKPVINIPGPPVAMFYGLEWCIRAIVVRLQHIPMPKRQTIQGVLTEEIKSPLGMEILCKMDVSQNEEGYLVKQKGWKHGSMVDTLGAGAYYITDLEQNLKCPGEVLEVTLLRGEEEF